MEKASWWWWWWWWWWWSYLKDFRETKTLTWKDLNMKIGSIWRNVQFQGNPISGVGGMKIHTITHHEAYHGSRTRSRSMVSVGNSFLLREWRRSSNPNPQKVLKKEDNPNVDCPTHMELRWAWLQIIYGDPQTRAFVNCTIYSFCWKWLFKLQNSTHVTISLVSPLIDQKSHKWIWR